MRHIPYAQWRREKEDEYDISGPVFDCSDCSGHGQVPSVCDCCNQQAGEDKDCKSCLATGRVEFDELSHNDRHEMLCRERYIKECANDLA